jgi:hypothetical protein
MSLQCEAVNITGALRGYRCGERAAGTLGKRARQVCWLHAHAARNPARYQRVTFLDESPPPELVSSVCGSADYSEQRGEPSPGGQDFEDGDYSLCGTGD